MLYSRMKFSKIIFKVKKKRMEVGIPYFNLLENECLSVESLIVFHGVYWRG